VHDVAIDGIVAGRALALTNVTVLRSGLDGVTATRRLTGSNITVNDNQYSGIYAETVLASDVTANGNGYSGVTGKRCRLTRLTANGNGMEEIQVGAGAGVQSVIAVLVDSTLTGNFVDDQPVDVDTFRRPRLLNSTCDHSRQRNDVTAAWGVCTAD